MYLYALSFASNIVADLVLQQQRVLQQSGIASVIACAPAIYLGAVQRTAYPIPKKIFTQMYTPLVFGKHIWRDNNVYMTVHAHPLLKSLSALFAQESPVCVHPLVRSGCTDVFVSALHTAIPAQQQHAIARVLNTFHHKQTKVVQLVQYRWNAIGIPWWKQCMQTEIFSQWIKLNAR